MAASGDQFQKADVDGSAIPVPQRRDIPVAVGLFLLGVLSRLPFRSQVLHHWDSVNFALGMEHFDVYLHQPHPPGYFLYIMLGRLVNLLIGDANASLVWICVVASGLAAVLIFVLGQSLWSRQCGLVAALLLLSSPLFWFHGEVALSYMVEAVFVILIALLCYRHLTGSEKRIWLSAFVLGIAGGFRPNTMVFLFPLWVVATWRFRWQQKFWALTLLALTCAAWLGPMIAYTGGVARYWAAIGSTSEGIATESSLFDWKQVIVNAVRLMTFTCYALLAGLLPLAIGGWLWGKRSLRQWRLWLRDPQVQLFFWWIAPSLAFYLVIHIRQQGHSFTCMPAVLLLTGAAIDRVADGVGERRRTLHVSLVASVLSLNVLFFVMAPAALFDSSRLLLRTPGWRSIHEQDLYVRERVEAIRAHFAPQSAAVLAGGRSFRYPDYYLRDYQDPSLSYRLKADETVLENVSVLVLFDSELLDRLSGQALVHHLSLPDGDVLSYISCGNGGTIAVSSVKISCRP